MGYVRDHKASKECMSLLSQARSFVGARRVDKAKEIYRRVIDEYPDTTYAEEAVKRLIQLP
jgi:TolA-binding protein